MSSSEALASFQREADEWKARAEAAETERDDLSAHLDEMHARLDTAKQRERDFIERLTGLITEDDLAEGPANPEGAVEAVLYDTFAWFRKRAEAAEARVERLDRDYITAADRAHDAEAKLARVEADGLRAEGLWDDLTDGEKD